MRHPVLVAVCLYIAGWLIFEKVLANPMVSVVNELAPHTSMLQTDRETEAK